MSTLRYVTHPNVQVDPSIPIDRWALSPEGRARAEAMTRQPWVDGIDRIVSSDETKALDTAHVLASHLGLEVEVRGGLGENDRSATGYLPPELFEQMADRFFAEPDRSAEGWERAVDAQRRIVDGLGDLLERPSARSTAVIGHGGVGTLLYCWLTGQPISRELDQPGQGHYFSVDLDHRTVLHPWRPIDTIDAT